MRKFHSYGPVDCRYHFFIERKELVRKCFDQLAGTGEEYGHYFTIWAPRQTGKTWLMSQAKKEIENHYKDRFIVADISMQRITMKETDTDEMFFKQSSRVLELCFNKPFQNIETWDQWIDIFSKDKGVFNKPIILFIDEFDSLPRQIIDQLVRLFRDNYLNRAKYNIHGLALIGVRAVLGVDSLRGSPFNIQRSLHVPNFTKDEVLVLFQQYEQESCQKIDSDVIENLYNSTRGQPGLIGWFGELLTEKYNPGKDKTIDIDSWKRVYMRSLSIEWNNNILNLVKKAKGTYQDYVTELFTSPDIEFAIDSEWCNYLYLNGIIDVKILTNENNEEKAICIFSSPFIQHRLYNAFTSEIIGERLPISAIEPLDDLSDVLENDELDLYALLQRYKNYLKRLKAKGINPWKDQPRRADLHLTEAVGHFHLYAWLHNAIGRRCSISPEFPTGNGRVDLHIKCNEKKGIIEVKSFTDISEGKKDRIKASNYAKKMGLKSITMAVFAPVEDENVLAKISGEEIIDGINVRVFTIGWV